MKQIRFKYRVEYDAKAGGKVLLNENDVETCCLLERLRNAKDYIPLKLDMEEYHKIKDDEKK